MFSNKLTQQSITNRKGQIIQFYQQRLVYCELVYTIFENIDWSLGT